MWHVLGASAEVPTDVLETLVVVSLSNTTFRPTFLPCIAIELLSSLLSGQGIYSVVAEIDGQVIGSNILWESASIAGVGPITIDPAVQNSNVGRALMENVLERARKQRFVGIRLVQAAYHNRPLALYTKLGFDAREPLSTLARLFGWKSRGTLSV